MELLKKIAKWLSNVPILIFIGLMFLGNIVMAVVVTKFNLALAPILIFNLTILSAAVIAYLSKFLNKKNNKK